MNLPIGILTIEQAAARRGCSASTIWRRVRAGELRLQRVLGRLVAMTEDVDALVIPSGRWNRRALLGQRREQGD